MLLIYDDATDTYKKEEYANAFSKSTFYTGKLKPEIVKELLELIGFYSLNPTNIECSLVKHMLRYASVNKGISNYSILVNAMNSFDTIVSIGKDINLPIPAKDLLLVLSCWKSIGETKISNELVKSIISDYYTNEQLKELLIELY